MQLMLTLINVLFVAFIGFYAGKFMGMTVRYLPEILLEGDEEGREPREIIGWFFQKSFSLKFNVLPFEVGFASLCAISTLFFEVDASLIFVLIVSWLLICCFITDYQHGILPDQLTLSLVWVGLIGSLFPIFVTPSEAIIGAVGGYGIFWIFNVIYRYFKGQEGMFPGDFKLNAGIGACVGFNVLVPILIASMLLLLAVTFIQYLLRDKKKESNYLSREVPYACFVSVVILAVVYLKLANF